MAVVGLAILTGACGAGGRSIESGLASLTSAEREAIQESSELPKYDAETNAARDAFLEWADQGGHDLVDVPGIGLVPANEAWTYLVEPGRDH